MFIMTDYWWTIIVLHLIIIIRINSVSLSLLGKLIITSQPLITTTNHQKIIRLILTTTIYIYLPLLTTTALSISDHLQMEVLLPAPGVAHLGPVSPHNSAAESPNACATTGSCPRLKATIQVKSGPTRTSEERSSSLTNYLGYPHP